MPPAPVTTRRMVRLWIPHRRPAAPRGNVGGRLGELADPEDLRAAVRARTLDRGTTVLHRHLLRVLDLHLLAFLDAVTLGHHQLLWGSMAYAVKARLRLPTDNARLSTCQSAQILPTLGFRRLRRRGDRAASVLRGSRFRC